jgi:hypothetical protein
MSDGPTAGVIFATVPSGIIAPWLLRTIRFSISRSVSRNRAAAWA